MLNLESKINSIPAPPIAEREAEMPVVLVEQTERSVSDAFEKICGCPITVDDSLTGGEDRIRIVGIISFVGDLMWSLALILPHDSAEATAQKFAGFEIPFDSADMGDVVGELINVLAGVLCGNLEAAGVKSQMSLPTVARGDAFELMRPDNLVSKRSYFTAGPIDFMVDITAMKTN